MNETTKRLLAALVDIGTQDIYTDADEYQDRVGAMQNLLGLARRVASGKAITEADIENALKEEPDDDELGEEQ